MRAPQRLSVFVASQVSRREFLRRSSTMALGVALAVPALGRNQGALDLTTFQRIRFDTPRVLSASEVVAQGLTLYFPDNQLPTGPDCPCDCTWGCHWVQVGSCYDACGSCSPGCSGFPSCGQKHQCDWKQCLDCCNDVCEETCSPCACIPCCC